MLITMLICWAARGYPIYWFMDTDQFPVYISVYRCDKPKATLHSVCWLARLRVRSHFTLRACIEGIPISESVVHQTERNLILASFICGGLAQIALLMVTIFSTAKHHHGHIGMLAVFIVFMFFSSCFLTAEYFLMGKHYALIHYKNTSKEEQMETITSTFESNSETTPHTEGQTSSSSSSSSENVTESPTVVGTEKDHSPTSQIRHRTPWYKIEGYKWNKFTISALCKLIWIVLAVVWAMLFGLLTNDSRSADFEWLLHFRFVQISDHNPISRLLLGV